VQACQPKADAQHGAAIRTPLQSQEHGTHQTKTLPDSSSISVGRPVAHRSQAGTRAKDKENQRLHDPSDPASFRLDGSCGAVCRLPNSHDFNYATRAFGRGYFGRCDRSLWRFGEQRCFRLPWGPRESEILKSQRGTERQFQRRGGTP
jgi:hypothetical protein